MGIVIVYLLLIRLVVASSYVPPALLLLGKIYLVLVTGRIKLKRTNYT